MVATFVLIHGGGHGGWCYQPLARRLRAAGHEVYTPSLAGCGERANLVSPAIDLDLHIDDVVRLLEWEGLHDVILAGHSYGGMVITGVADRAPQRLKELVYLDAAHPQNGESLRVTAPVQIEPQLAGARDVGEATLVMWPFPGMAARFGDFDAATAAWIDERLTPHPWACFDQPLRLRNGPPGNGVPRTNINCTASLANSPPEARARQTDGERNFEIDTGHDLMLTEPDRVAELLLTLV